jgi:hypothetical protein
MPGSIKNDVRRGRRKNPAPSYSAEGESETVHPTLFLSTLMVGFSKK